MDIKKLSAYIAESIASVMQTTISTIVSSIISTMEKENEEVVRNMTDKYNNLESERAKLEDEVRELCLDKQELGKINIDYANEINGLKGRIAELEEEPKEAPKASEPKAKKVPKAPTGAVHSKFKKILALVKTGKNVYQYGEAGTGKNVIAEQVADALGLDFYMSSKLNDEYGIKGYGDMNGRFVETPFYKAWKYGGLFLLDEMDASASQAVVALNTALSSNYFDFPVIGKVGKHPNFRVIANGNTNGKGATEDYGARDVLDSSTLDRFTFITVDYDENIELACAKGDKELVQFVHECRSACKKMHQNVVLISYRGISNFVDVMNMPEFTVEEALEATILKGIDIDNMTQLHNCLEHKVSNKYAKALNECIWQMNNASAA